MMTQANNLSRRRGHGSVKRKSSGSILGTTITLGTSERSSVHVMPVFMDILPAHLDHLQSKFSDDGAVNAFRRTTMLASMAYMVT